MDLAEVVVCLPVLAAPQLGDHMVLGHFHPQMGAHACPAQIFVTVGATRRRRGVLLAAVAVAVGLVGGAAAPVVAGISGGDEKVVHNLVLGSGSTAKRAGHLGCHL